MVKKLSLIIVFSLAFLECYSANLENTPSKCEAFRPNALYHSLLYEKEMSALAKSKTFGQEAGSRKDKEYWIVFSDRDNNTTYNKPGGTQYGSLKFNEKLRIAKIISGWALVYSEPKVQEIYPKISSQAEWKGWVPMSKLLLWTTCPANEKGIYNKAMLCVNIDKGINNGKLGLNFLNPERLSESKPLEIDFRYYFVMKKEGDMVLLSYQNTMNGDSDKVLLGWVDENSFVEWNQRSCLEPTWDVEDVEFFAKHGTQARIYEDKNEKTLASRLPYSTNALSGVDPSEAYRMDGKDLRFPILDGGTSALWNCSTFSTPEGKAIKRSSMASNVLGETLEQLSNINIAIVIDGTKSMENFFPAVKDAIKEFANYYSKSEHVKVGVVIYRDKADGDKVTQVFNLTNPNNPNLGTFLDKVSEDIRTMRSQDKTLEEALFYGIDKALDAFNFDPRQSNMMFVVGDCGNCKEYPTITKEAIINKLAEKEVSICGFQVRNDPNQSAYASFNDNMCDLIYGTLQKRYSRLDQRVKILPKRTKNAFEFENNAADESNSLYVGIHKYVQAGVLDVSALKNQLELALTKVNQTITNQKDVINDAEKGVLQSSFLGSDVSMRVQLEMSYLKKKVGDKNLPTNQTISFKGYVRKKDNSSDRDFFKTVIFISSEELNNLILRLKPLFDVAQAKGNNREPYIAAMKALVQSMFPNLTDAELRAKGNNEIMGLIAGLNASTNTLKGRTLMEISSPQIVNAQEYQTIIQKFKRNYLKLQNIQKSKYFFVKEFNGAKYYWIPTEDLP